MAVWHGAARAPDHPHPQREPRDVMLPRRVGVLAKDIEEGTQEPPDGRDEPIPMTRLSDAGSPSQGGFQADYNNPAEGGVVGHYRRRDCR